MTGAEMVQDFRRGAGLTQKRLGEMIGRTRQWVHQVERGDIIISPGLVCEFAEVLGPAIIQPLLQKACEEWLSRQGIDAVVTVACREVASAEI